MPQSHHRARRITRFWPLVSASVALALGLLLGLVIMLRGNSALLIDAEWMDEIVEHRSPFWAVPSFVMNFLGGGWFAWVVSVAVIVALLFARRRWAAIYFTILSVVSATLVQVLKVVFARARPEDILIHIDSGAFPSGHVANAATMAMALAIILWRRWVWFAGAAYVILMMLSRTYLGAHWLSDTVGGLLIGAGLAVIVWAPFASRVQSERVRQ
jgi:membrane-associated phospholipid phosphatase